MKDSTEIAISKVDKPLSKNLRDTHIPDFSTNEEIRIPMPGDRIGPLLVLETIASGGMAIVYKVKHVELEVIRAIKMLKPGCKKEFKQRLYTEAKIAAHLHLPYIVQIYNVSLWNQSHPYIEMEYVNGPTLFDLLSIRKTIPIAVTAAIGSLTCKALAYASRQKITVYEKEYTGLIHRDIKPANIMLSSLGTVKLADFGIALPGNESIHTTDQTVMGTGPYISPEQINGDKLDVRTDIYSLGAVLYELIAGVKAFPQKKIPELMRDKMKGRIEPLSNLVKDTPLLLENTLIKAMAANRTKRFENAQEFGDALDAFLGTLTSKSADTIVKEYSDSNGLVTVDHKASRHRKSFSRKSIIIGTIIASVAISAFISGLFLMRKPAIAPVPQKATPTTALSDTQPLFTTSQLAKQPADGVPESGMKNLKASFSNPNAALPGSAPASLPEHTTLNNVDQISKAFSTGSWNAVIAFSEEPVLADDRGTRARCMIAAAFAHAGRTKDALAYLTLHAITDGWPYARIAQAQFTAGDKNSALTNALEASRRTSLWGNAVTQEASMLIARIRNDNFHTKPNRDNQLAAENAWKAVRTNFCGEATSAECLEAEAALANLSE